MVWKGGSNIAAGTDPDVNRGMARCLPSSASAHNLSQATEALTIELVQRRGR
jgi:hypothetical protein